MCVPWVCPMPSRMESDKLSFVHVGLDAGWAQEYTCGTMFVISIPEMLHFLILSLYKEACLPKGFSAQHIFELFSFPAEPCWGIDMWGYPASDSLIHVLSTLVQWLSVSQQTRSLLCTANEWWVNTCPFPSALKQQYLYSHLRTTLQMIKIEYKC